MSNFIKLKELLSKEEIKDQEVFKILDELEKSFLTNLYVRNCLHSCVIEEGMGEKYYESFRYKYAGQHLDEFKDTHLYTEYLQALIDSNELDLYRDILQKVEKIEANSI